MTGHDVETVPWRYVTRAAGRHSYVQLVCAIPVVEHAWSDDDDAMRALPPHECGADVMVAWTFSVPVMPGSPTAAEVVYAEAVASSWEASCENGHVLAVASIPALTAGDTAETFDPDVVFGPVPS